jgi:xanthine dehydrogenase YagR molybdenum-binding subunit
MSEPVVGRPLTRVDGVLKVTGAAPYADEFNPSGITYAVLIQSTVPSGRARVDAGKARRMPGVLAVLTHENALVLPQQGRAAVNPPAGRVLSLLQDDKVNYNGEPIGVVVAETFEQAVDAAARVTVSYSRSTAQLDFQKAKSRAYAPKKLTRGPPDQNWGDADAGLREAQVRIDRVYATPMEHHNPMEPHATVAQWEGARLTLHDATQGVSGVKQTVAKTFGIAAELVRIINPFVGGGFGCKGSAWSHVVLAAMAAKQVGRPVKLVLSRPQMFGPVGGRPQTEQRVVLGARSDGRLTSIRHDAITHTSFMEDFAEPSTEPTRSLYACANGATTQRLLQLNVGVPTFTRAPGECTGSFAIESAMDELAIELGIDPLELRLRNYAEFEPSTGKPWSSKRLRDCYQAAAGRFGWTRRNPEPRSMRDGRWLVGWGMGTATYPAHRQEASASARLLRDGTVIVRSGTQDLGTGTYTVMTQVAADALGIPIERVRFELGDTAFPPAPGSGGSTTAASVGPAVQNACKALREKMQAARPGEPLEASGSAKPGEELEKLASRSFGAVFAEVRIHEQTGVLRVPRIVAAYSVGHLLNAKTALSQLQGGIVWGVGQALFENSVLDTRYGRFVNGNLAEYHVPVNADIHDIDVSFVEENDTAFNPLGVRGIGEIGITAVAAVIANAVHHATGKRIRELPITLDKLL